MGEKSGFTLLELILVMVIIGILASMVVVSVSGRGTEARIVKAKHDLSVYRTAVEAYALEHKDKYPKALEDLVRGDKQYVMEIKKDGWGQPYVYEYPAKRRQKKYDIYSRGPDEIAGTEDDISCWDE